MVIYLAVYKSGTGSWERESGDLGLSYARRGTWGHQVWDAGDVWDGKQGRQKQGHRGRGMWMIIAKVGGKCDTSFFVKMCYLWSTFPVRNEQRCCSAVEWLQEALQKSWKRAGLQQSQILAAVESPLTAINIAVAAVQEIPESWSPLQSGCKVASKRQRMLLPVMRAYQSLVQKKKRNANFNNTVIMIHGRGVDKALL